MEGQDSIIKIETGTKLDIPALSRLIAALFSVEEDFTPNLNAHAKGLELLIDRGGVVFVARAGTEIAAMATVQLVASTAEGALSAWIEDVFVLPDYRKRGTGRELICAIEDWAKAQGATRLQLLAEETNHPALSFYDAIGFSRTSLRALKKSIRNSL
jgi:GNAT superfamily N-acetyltransferase